MCHVCLLCILISQAFPFLRRLCEIYLPKAPGTRPCPVGPPEEPHPLLMGKRTYLYDYKRCHSSVLIIRQRAVQCLLLLCACCVDVQPSDHHSSSPVAPFSLLIGVPEGNTVRYLQWQAKTTERYCGIMTNFLSGAARTPGVPGTQITVRIPLDKDLSYYQNEKTHTQPYCV